MLPKQNPIRLGNFQETFPVTDIQSAIRKKKYVAVGTGGRIPMFIDPIARDYNDSSEILAFCDSSKVRMDYHVERLAREYGVRGIRTYAPQEFERTGINPASC